MRIRSTHIECQGWGEWMRRGLKCRLRATYLIKIKQTNKQKLPRRGKTDWLAGKAELDKAGQGWTGHRRHQTLGNEPTRNCKHKEIIKGANDEGNEGKQLGKINQPGNKMGGVKTNWREHVAHRKLGQKPRAHTKQKHKHMASKQITSHVQNRTWTRS